MDSRSNNLPKLLDFYATWCGPCKALAPAVDAIAEEYEGRLDVEKIDIDQHPDLTKSYKVRSVPTLVLLDTEGEVISFKVGALSKSDLKLFVERVLS